MSKFCQSCGEQSPPKLEFCLKCGAAAFGPTPPGVAAPLQPPQPTTTALPEHQPRLHTRAPIHTPVPQYQSPAGLNVVTAYFRKRPIGRLSYLGLMVPIALLNVFIVAEMASTKSPQWLGAILISLALTAGNCFLVYNRATDIGWDRTPTQLVTMVPAITWVTAFFGAFTAATLTDTHAAWQAAYLFSAVVAILSHLVLLFTPGASSAQRVS